MAYPCTICKLDGETVDAVAEYTDSLGAKNKVCEKHLENVKEAGLEFNEIQDFGETPFYDAEDCTECDGSADQMTWIKSDCLWQCDSCGASF